MEISWRLGNIHATKHQCLTKSKMEIIEVILSWIATEALFEPCLNGEKVLWTPMNISFQSIYIKLNMTYITTKSCNLRTSNILHRCASNPTIKRCLIQFSHRFMLVKVLLSVGPLFWAIQRTPPQSTNNSKQKHKETKPKKTKEKQNPESERQPRQTLFLSPNENGNCLLYCPNCSLLQNLSLSPHQCPQKLHLLPTLLFFGSSRFW